MKCTGYWCADWSNYIENELNSLHYLTWPTRIFLYLLLRWLNFGLRILLGLQHYKSWEVSGLLQFIKLVATVVKPSKISRKCQILGDYRITPIQIPMWMAAKKMKWRIQTLSLFSLVSLATKFCWKSPWTILWDWEKRYDDNLNRIEPLKLVPFHNLVRAHFKAQNCWWTSAQHRCAKRHKLAKKLQRTRNQKSVDSRFLNLVLSSREYEQEKDPLSVEGLRTFREQHIS